MREILTHFLSYSQIPESPPAAETDETASKKSRKQKEKKKEKPKGKVRINQSRVVSVFEIAGISFYTSINLRGNILWRMSVVSLMYSCTGRQRNNLFRKRLYIYKAKTNTIREALP